MPRPTKRPAPPVNKRGRPAAAADPYALTRAVRAEATKRGLSKHIVDRAFDGDFYAMSVVCRIALPERPDSTLPAKFPILRLSTDAGRRSAVDEISARLTRREISVEQAGALLALVERAANLDVSTLIARFEEQLEGGTPPPPPGDGQGPLTHGIHRLATLATRGS